MNPTFILNSQFKPISDSLITEASPYEALKICFLNTENLKYCKENQQIWKYRLDKEYSQHIQYPYLTVNFISESYFDKYYFFLYQIASGEIEIAITHNDIDKIKYLLSIFLFKSTKTVLLSTAIERNNINIAKLFISHFNYTQQEILDIFHQLSKEYTFFSYKEGLIYLLSIID